MSVPTYQNSYPEMGVIIILYTEQENEDPGDDQQQPYNKEERPGPGSLVWHDSLLQDDRPLSTVFLHIPRPLPHHLTGTHVPGHGRPHHGTCVPSVVVETLRDDGSAISGIVRRVPGPVRPPGRVVVDVVVRS